MVGFVFYVIYKLDRNKNLKYIASEINAKFIKNAMVNWNKLKKEDIVISNDEEITKKAKIRKITAIHLMENGHFDKDSEEKYDFSFYYIKRYEIRGFAPYKPFARAGSSAAS